MWEKVFTLFIYLLKLLLGSNDSCPSTEQLPVNTVDRQQVRNQISTIFSYANMFVSLRVARR